MNMITFFTSIALICTLILLTWNLYHTHRRLRTLQYRLESMQYTADIYENMVKESQMQMDALSEAFDYACELLEDDGETKEDLHRRILYRVGWYNLPGVWPNKNLHRRK